LQNLHLSKGEALCNFDFMQVPGAILFVGEEIIYKKTDPAIYFSNKLSNFLREKNRNYSYARCY